MPTIKYSINLTEQEQKQLKSIVSKGKAPAREILRANILLAADRNSKKPMTVSQTAVAFNTTATTVQTVRREYANGGLEKALHRKKRVTPPVAAKVTGEVEAHIIALACSEPPKGYAKWTLRLLASRAVELGYIDSISHVHVGRVLKKTNAGRT